MNKVRSDQCDLCERTVMNSSAILIARDSERCRTSILYKHNFGELFGHALYVRAIFVVEQDTLLYLFAPLLHDKHIPLTLQYMHYLHLFLISN